MPLIPSWNGHFSNSECKKHTAVKMNRGQLHFMGRRNQMEISVPLLKPPPGISISHLKIISYDILSHTWMFEIKLTNACDKLLLFKLFFKKKKSIIFILPFPYVGRKNNTKRPCVIPSLNKQDEIWSCHCNFHFTCAT